MIRALLLFCAAVAPLAAQCTYSVSPTQIDRIPAAGGSRSAGVIASPDTCTWKYSADVAWITFSGAKSGDGMGQGSFIFTVAPNPTPSAVNAPRAGHIRVDGTNPPVNLQITVSQEAPVCSLAIDPKSGTTGVAGGSGSFNVQTNCTWRAGGSPAWLTFTPPAAGTASTTLAYNAAPNSCVSARTGSIVVQSDSIFVPSQAFVLTEDGSPNNLSLAPATFTAPATETTGNFAVQTGANCAWSALSQASWIEILPGSSGTGNGRVGFRVRPNPGVQRTGTILVGPRTFVVTQDGIPATPVVLTAVVNAASGTGDGVSPGEIVSLFGSNLGTPAGTALQVGRDGKVTTSLAGTRVLFDGAESPLTFARADQVNAVVPYSLTRGSSTQIQVEYQGALSAPLSMPVKAATPGIFTIPPVGTGSGAVLNQDLQVNSPARPASRGDVIAIYCTGGGSTTPASIDGAVTAQPFPALTLPLAVTIGGVDAPDIRYKGAAPGAIAGLTQINVKIPDTVTPGSTVTVIVTIGGTPSQQGVTIAIQ